MKDSSQFVSLLYSSRISSVYESMILLTQESNVVKGDASGSAGFLQLLEQKTSWHGLQVDRVLHQQSAEDDKRDLAERAAR